MLLPYVTLVWPSGSKQEYMTRKELILEAVWERLEDLLAQGQGRLEIIVMESGKVDIIKSERTRIILK